MEAGYTINAEGEKVLAGSRRPDGTLRKERRIRSGYTPQDEQPVYQSGGVLARQNIPKCPGLDPAEAVNSGAAKSKAAKKNEKRKAAKKADAGQATGSATSKVASLPPTNHERQQQQQQSPLPETTQEPQQQLPSVANDSGPGGGISSSSSAVLDKQIKALSKKVRQCEALLVREEGGEALSDQEREKLSKMSGWREEVRQLEHQLSKMMHINS